MFRIESYVTPILLSYVDKYVRDFKPADAQVSLWGGGVALHNLVLKADVLQQEVALPFKLVSGRIHELLIQVPWTKIMSEPIVVTIDTIECVLSLNRPTSASDETSAPEVSRRETHVVEAPPGYMQALVRRIVSNISLRIHHLIVKYVQDDIVLSLNVKHLAIDSAGTDWIPTFADIDQSHPVVRRLVVLDDLTLCLDRADADGKIRFYQEPLLYRCQLDLRVLTRLVSANTRRLSSLTVELRSSKLAWGVTNDQLTLLLRMIRERTVVDVKPPTPAPKASGTNVALSAQLSTASTNIAEPARSGSWSEWAWSWLPTWKDREDLEETAKTPMPVPIHFTAFFDEVSVVFKMMEFETKARKRGRAILEIMANHAAIMSYICAPTTIRLRIGTRGFSLTSRGKCVCGHTNFQTLHDQQTIYISKIKSEQDSETTWTWPEDQAADVGEFSAANIKPYNTKNAPTEETAVPDTQDTTTQMSDLGLPEEPTSIMEEQTNDNVSFWAKMSPLIFIELNHERTPPVSDINPYENPPIDFQYSDWIEEAMVKMVFDPIEIRVDMGLIHRLAVLLDIYRELPPVPEPEETMRVLTVEECEALSENLPQRRITLEMIGWRVRILPWDHSTSDRPKAPPLFLDLDMPKNVVMLNGPLYPLRVCAAACQMPEDTGPVWQGARLHITFNLTSVGMAISAPNEKNPRHCGRADIIAVAHMLLNKNYFTKRESIHVGYSIKISEANICGSAPRLMAALQIPLSLITEKFSIALRYSSLPKDALKDEDAVAIDLTMEDMVIRGYKTAHIVTHIVLLQSIKITALHENNRNGGTQAWLLSAPDNPTSSPFLRLAVQFCLEPVSYAFEYIGIWTEPTAVAIDPLFIAWLAYRPSLRSSETNRSSVKTSSSTQFFIRRKGSTQSSSGRGGSRSGSGADMIHMRTRSADSSEKTESKDKNATTQDTEAPKPVTLWPIERLQALHQRLKRMYINVELGLTLAYITMTTVSALDCATIRDAIERHANDGEKVLTVSLGRIFLFSSTISKQFWYEIKHDGPTFKERSAEAPEKESFPWKMRIADLACYTLEMTSELDKYERDKAASGLRSQLRNVCLAKPKTVLELVTSTVTISTVTKSIHYIKTGPKPEPKQKSEDKPVDDKLKYFKTGMSFKPTTLKEFVRGPANRKKNVEEKKEVKSEAPKPEIASGPIVSIGVHVHADTPPLILRLDQKQVQVVSAALHCLIHILTLLNRPPLQITKHSYVPYTAPSRFLVRSVSEENASQSQSDTLSEERSGLISIYESVHMQTFDVKTFFCLQWVVSRVSVVVISDMVKLAFDLEDIISTLDFQTHYNQLKLKVAAASIKHYHKNASDEWVAEVIGGRVLEARDPMDDHFMSITVTQAQISNLPEQWKQELHPKLLEQKTGSDTMWEVYMTLAALESVIQPKLVKHIYSLIYNMAPKSFCPLKRESVKRSSDWQLPYVYLSAGGLRVLLTSDKRNLEGEDTFILSLGKVTITPHPENPICRRVVNTGLDTGWASGESYEGRQYEIYLRNVDLRSAQFIQLIDEIASVEMLKEVENPALKWAQSITSPVITPLLHSVDIGCVLAPATYKSGVLVAGPALELNLVSDCSVELNLNQLVLATELMTNIKQVMKESDEDYSEEWQWHTCPYNKIIITHTTMDCDVLSGISETTATHAEKSTTSETFRSVAVDSGIDSYSPGSHTKFGREDTIKKAVSIAGFEYPNDPNDFLEIFVTMGTIAISLYTVDDGSALVESLRPPAKWVKPAESEPETPIATPATSRPEQLPITKSVIKKIEEEKRSGGSSVKELSENESESNRSLSVTETIRDTDIGRTKLQLPLQSQARGGEGNLPLIHLTLNQPNLYYWRNKTQKNMQISLFDAWLCLGASRHHNLWHEVLLSTSRGIIDPVTDIPPALATLKICIPNPAQSQSTIASRGTINLDVERPVQLEISFDRLNRLITIQQLIKEKLHTEVLQPLSPEKIRKRPLLYKFRGSMVLNTIESITIQATQFAIVGMDGAVGWDSASFQVGAGGRPDRLVGRALISALVISADPPGDTRHMVLQPLTFGMELEATWEAWRKTEGIAFREPMIRVTLELDRVTLDLRPADMATVARLKRKIHTLQKKEEAFTSKNKLETASTSTTKNVSTSCVTFEGESTDSDTCGSADEHFYKDDIRSGAFKLMSGGQLPMAYQVTLHKDAVSWRYPHPRAITRLVAFPLPGQDSETPCVLELYNTQLNRWERHTYFSIPVGEPKELCLYVPPPDAVFSVMWRYRACYSVDRDYGPFEFSINKFQPRSDPLYNDPLPEIASVKCSSRVSAEQLSGVVRVDSCFSPRLLPRISFVTRIANLAIHLHNSPPHVASQATYLEGYYVSKPLMRSHRVLTLAAQDATAHAQLASPAGSLILLQSDLASDCIDCTTGTMEQLVGGFHAECGLSLPTGAMSRARVSLSDVHVALHVPRLRTLHALVRDWQQAIKFYNRTRKASTESAFEEIRTKKEIAEVTAAALEGRVSLWVHNTCGSALRVGQEGTDEVVPLGPGTSLAYRWRSPSATKKLRFALAGPATDWHWSTSVSFGNVGGPNRVRLQDAEALLGNGRHGTGVYLYTSVEEIGSRRSLKLAGRLCLANMLRFHLLYKVRSRGQERQWRTLYSGEISAETFGNSVICGADTEMALKIKFSSSDTGWSGDIPLRECPKENVPWLVKVPCEGDTPFMSVWCRVVRARNDGRILATIWPLYVLYSHLPLDTDVLISTKCDQSSNEQESQPNQPTPLIQTAPGRGTSTHLLAPGTTAARHTLSFQYRSINCPVTREAVPLHYGVTFTSVFEKRASIGSIEEVLQEVNEWMKRCSHDVISGWPYSIVMKHWPYPWQPATMQPRCDVVVHYQAVKAGGGCSLEVQLCPVVLLCNAAPIPLTLRAHDAAPLCKVEPGCAIAPPSAVLSKPFFISMEIGRETFVSGELSVSGAELGRYGATPHGRVALDRPAELTILCSQKVALLTMYYEIKEDINVLGLSTTYVLLNKMDTDISISAVAVPSDANEDSPLRPTTFKVVEPTSKAGALGLPLCRFMLVGRWRGSDPNELRMYLFVGLPVGGSPVRATPIRLGHPPVRRAVALTDENDKSVPIVVTQVHHEGRWVITVGPDPCPQLIIHNRTSAPLAVAQPARAHDEPTTSKVMVQQECPGTRWNCIVHPDAVTHYSTPAHCLRYPPPNNSPHSSDPALTFLTFAAAQDADDMDWCVPVAVTDGEQLLQLTSGMTVKLRVRTHPHSTHLELRDVDKRDISASDIRKRLLGPFSSGLVDKEKLEDEKLERINAAEKLFDPEIGGEQVLPVKSSASKSTVEPAYNANIANRRTSPSSIMLLPESGEEQQRSKPSIAMSSKDAAEADNVLREVTDPEWDENASWSGSDRLRIVAASIAVDLAQTSDTLPLVALHLDRPSIVVHADTRRTKTSISIGDVQVDNLQYETGQFDFGVVATTRDGDSSLEDKTCLWNLFSDMNTFGQKEAKALLKLTHDSWTVLQYSYTELTEVDINMGPMALYIEDAYVTSVARLWRRAVPVETDSVTVADERPLQRPLTLRLLHIHPLDLTLTLHTAVRMYIALDQSPLRLSAFKLQDTMTSPEWLTHALTVHYLSAAILGAGWVVGGLELLGAPGALAARVGGARGGVRGVASAAAAALLRSLSAWAGSLARNLDLLAGDEEHARRAAAARRRPPTSFMAGLATGITNFAINILGAVGGLAHHPLVGVAVGESDSSATALRRGLLGALAKPLSATADLVAFAGHGLLTQTGWDPVPQPRRSGRSETGLSAGWRRDCVRWSFRLAELSIFVGFHILLDSTPLLLLLTHRFLVVTDPDLERIVEMIDFKFCSIGPYQGQIIELVVSQKRQSRMMDTRTDEDDEYQISAAAMARVARYTGAESSASTGESRVLSLLPAPSHAYALHAALTVAVHYNADSHFKIL